ncbi:MAG TPA: class II aldolase/adducin family protein [Streptosporangiaceae bacterium]|nr:class II aldolase/adducin family protein [Streptosporangiaceae bacterium]
MTVGSGLAAAETSAGRTAVAEAANVLAQLGLVTAYGHVSARAGQDMLITPAADLAAVTASQVIAVPLTATPPLPAGVPAEAWAHLALYRARPDAAAIARAQPVGAFAAAATTTSLVPLHGQAAWLGESIPVHDSALLLRSPELAERAARTLAGGTALLLRGNGAITLGARPGLAVARMWILAAACEVYLAARGVRETMGTGFGTPYSVTPLSADEIASWRAVGDELLPRLWQHLRRR